MADDIHGSTRPLKRIAVDYTQDMCRHCHDSGEIAISFNQERGGSRWRSVGRYQYGIFSAQIKCPDGNTSGLNYNLYLSSLEGEEAQDEIDFEFLGKDKTIVQTNYHTAGTGGREEIHDLGFDCSDEFHEYTIKWFPDAIEWLIDGKLIRRAERDGDCAFPEKPMFLYASIWDASYIADGWWTGPYVGCDAPYVCRFRNVHVPVLHSGTVCHEKQPLKEIVIDYSPHMCSHCHGSDEIAITFDHERGGSRWRSSVRYQYGTFSAQIKCPEGNTSGLIYNLYLSSSEGDEAKDEIDFQFLGKDKTIVQTNYHTAGTGGREEIHNLGFDCSNGYHEYTITWSGDVIEWLIDGELVRRVESNGNSAFPEKPMFLYASLWDASFIADGCWTGPYVGCDAPYVCRYRNVHVPVDTAVVE